MNFDGFQAAKSALLAAVRPRRAELASALAAAKGFERERRELFLALLTDPDLKTVSVAIRALGDLPGCEVEAALLAKLAKDARPEQRRALARALGSAGGEASRRALEALAGDRDDGELRRQAEHALLILGRRLVRARGLGAVDGGRVPSKSLSIVLRTRVGLESFVRDELFELRASLEHERPGRLEISWKRPLGELFAVRTAEVFAIAFPLPHAATEAEVLEALAHPNVVSTLAELTQGPIRFRLAWRDAKDSDRFRLLKALATRSPKLVNDSREAVWEIEVDAAAGRLEILPKRLEDPRFTYRRMLVPASSHAPLAAALARLAGARDDDVVWDPFAGAGAELVERAKRGAFRALIGTDLDPEAVTAARENLSAAGISGAEILQADASTFLPSLAPTLIISNPPLGRRVSPGEAAGVLHRVLEHAATVLAPGGRMVFLTPDAGVTDCLMERLGFRRSEARAIDLGGFSAALRRFDRPL